MNFLLILTSVCSFSLNSICTRVFQLKIENRLVRISLFQGLYCLIAAAVYLICGGRGAPDLKTVLYGAAFGLFFALACYCTAKCYECGPMSLTSVIVNLSVVIPILVSCAVWGERLGAARIGGLCLFVLTFILISKCNESRSVSVKWLALLAAAFISNGSTAVLQKQFMKTCDQKSGNLFMALAYLFSACFFIVLFFAGIHKTKAPEQVRLSHIFKTVLLSAAAGLGSFLGNKILLELSTRVNASVLYPCLNGGLCILLTVVSCVFFSERLTKRKAAAVLTGLISIVVINL